MTERTWHARTHVEDNSMKSDPAPSERVGSCIFLELVMGNAVRELVCIRT